MFILNIFLLEKLAKSLTEFMFLSNSNEVFRGSFWTAYLKLLAHYDYGRF